MKKLIGSMSSFALSTCSLVGTSSPMIMTSSSSSSSSESVYSSEDELLDTSLDSSVLSDACANDRDVLIKFTKQIHSLFLT